MRSGERVAVKCERGEKEGKGEGSKEKENEVSFGGRSSSTQATFVLPVLTTLVPPYQFPVFLHHRQLLQTRLGLLDDGSPSCRLCSRTRWSSSRGEEGSEVRRVEDSQEPDSSDDETLEDEGR